LGRITVYDINNFLYFTRLKYTYSRLYELLKFIGSINSIAAQKNKRSGETPPTFWQKNEFLETPLKFINVM
jgi:hypothetical protein